MIESMFMPLSRQPDDGFRVVGDAFRYAADHLRSGGVEGGVVKMYGHLPINYLYRHAVELYLKSMIVTAHRRLKLKSPDGSYDPTPQIPIPKSPKPIYSVHGIRALFDEMKRIFTAHRSEVSKFARTDWSSIPAELDAWINEIDGADPASTAFRYPFSKSLQTDEGKSSFKPIEFETLKSEMESGGRGRFALVMVDDNDSIVESFSLDDNPIPELRTALVGAVEMLAGAAFGVLVDVGTPKE